jgi:hypothetical protein
VIFKESKIRGLPYLVLIESVQIDGRTRRRTLANLGRIDGLKASGLLEELIRSLAKFSDRLAVAARKGPMEIPSGDGTGHRRLPGLGGRNRLPGLD